MFYVYISKSIGPGRFRSDIIAQILNSGNKITDSMAFASYVVGFADCDFGGTSDEAQIVLKREGYSFLIKAAQHLIDPGTLQMIKTGKSLTEWLKTAPDLLVAGA